MANSIDGKYIKVQGWMATQLELYGNDLIIYAYIYSFQFKDFMGKDVPTNDTKPKEIPLRDFMEWIDQSKRNVIRILQRLEDIGYIKIYITPGKTNAYLINKDIAFAAMKGKFRSGDTGDKMSPPASNVTGDKMSPHRCQNVTTTSDKDVTTLVTKSTKTGDKMSPHLQHNYKNNKNTTSTTTRMRACEASASSLTDTEPENGTETASPCPGNPFPDIPTMTGEEKAQYEALQAMRQEPRNGIRPVWMRTDPIKAFPEAFRFMDDPDHRMTKMERELVRRYTLYLQYGRPACCGPEPEERVPTMEEILTVDSPDDIGQEAHDAQVHFLQSIYGKDAPIQTAPKR